MSLLFLVLAILADLVGTAHDEAAAIAEQRGPRATTESTPRESLMQVSSISAAARPATPR